MSKRITISLPDGMHTWLLEYKRLFGVPMSVKIKELIREFIFGFDQQPTQPYVIMQNNMSVQTNLKTVQRNTGTLISPVMTQDVKNEFKDLHAIKIRQKEAEEDWSKPENIDKLRGVAAEIGN